MISIHAPPRGATLADCTASRFQPFQFTPLREGRRPDHRLWREAGTISIHAPPRGATRKPLTSSRGGNPFQFTPLREGRRWCPTTSRTATYFNSRPSARGDDCKLVGVLRDALFQFTPLREGRRGLMQYGDGINAISIHAPPRGATEILQRIAQQMNISIHAPPRGATFQVFCIPTEEIFQFTPLREGRHRNPDGCPSFPNFNSRPSARGDRCTQTIRSRRSYFNSRPSARGDFPGVRESGRRENFNSRPSARGDAAKARRTVRRSHFNSRPSARGDVYIWAALESPVEFQFTPLREGRHIEWTGEYLYSISIHAPPRGATFTRT